MSKNTVYNVVSFKAYRLIRTVHFQFSWGEVRHTSYRDMDLHLF